MGGDVAQNPKASDQMPEEAPEEQVLDDVPEAFQGAARETVLRHLRQMRAQDSVGRAGAEHEHGSGARRRPPA
jgi:hypothetical protein